MDVFIYFVGSLNCSLGDIEDALDAALHDMGEVTGTGTGEYGSNIDIYINNMTIGEQHIIDILRSTLKLFDVPTGATVTIDGRKVLI